VVSYDGGLHSLGCSLVCSCFGISEKRLQFLILHLHLFLFVAKKQKEEAPEEVKSGIFVFSNGDRYGTVIFAEILLEYLFCTSVMFM